MGNPAVNNPRIFGDNHQPVSLGLVYERGPTISNHQMAYWPSNLLAFPCALNVNTLVDDCSHSHWSHWWAGAAFFQWNDRLIWEMAGDGGSATLAYHWG